MRYHSLNHSNLKVHIFLIDKEIAKACVSVLAWEAIYVVHLDTANVAKVTEEAQNEQYFVLLDYPKLMMVSMLPLD